MSLATRARASEIVGRRFVAVLALAHAGLAAGCKKDSSPSQGSAPPPPAESAGKPGACAAGGGTVGDPASVGVFPRTAGGYCIDPSGQTRVFGEGEKLSMDAIC